MQAALDDPRPHDNATVPLHSGNCELIQHNGGLQSLVSALKEHRMIPLAYSSSVDKFRSLFQNDKDHPEAIEQQLDPRAADTEGRTALNFAVRYLIRSEDEGELQILQRLIIMYARQDQLTARPKSSFLHEAARVGNLYVLAELKKVYKDTPSCISRNCLQDLLSGTEDAYSPVVEALFSRSTDEVYNVRFVEEIVKMAGEFIQDQDILKEVKLESIHRRLMEEPQIRNQLSREILRRTTYKDVEDFTRGLPTYAALYAGQDGLFDLLLCSRVMNENQRDARYRRTCLHWAVLHRRADILQKLILRTRICPGLKDINGNTAFSLAIYTNNNEALRIMMAFPAFMKHEESHREPEGLFNLGFVIASVMAGLAFGYFLRMQPVKIFFGSREEMARKLQAVMYSLYYFSLYICVAMIDWSNITPTLTLSMLFAGLCVSSYLIWIGVVYTLLGILEYIHISEVTYPKVLDYCQFYGGYILSPIMIFTLIFGIGIAHGSLSLMNALRWLYYIVVRFILTIPKLNRCLVNGHTPFLGHLLANVKPYISISNTYGHNFFQASPYEIKITTIPLEHFFSINAMHKEPIVSLIVQS